MTDLDHRLDTIARAAASAAELPGPDAIRRRGRRLRRRSLAARGSLCVLLVAAVVSGALIGRAQLANRTAPAVGGGGDPLPFTSSVRQGRTYVQLYGRNQRGGTWSYWVISTPQGICRLDNLDSGPAPGKVPDCGDSGPGAGGSAGPWPLQPDEVNLANGGCAGGVDEHGRRGRWDSLFTGIADERAELVRVELLDGRSFDVRPVAHPLLPGKPFALYLPGCIGHVNTTVYGSGGRELSRRPLASALASSFTGGKPRSSGGELLVAVTFAASADADRRTELLVALENRGGELYKVDGNTYHLMLTATPNFQSVRWPPLRTRLDDARRAGLLTYQTRIAPAPPDSGAQPLPNGPSSPTPSASPSPRSTG
jgi:hypothetical protein